MAIFKAKINSEMLFNLERKELKTIMGYLSDLLIAFIEYINNTLYINIHISL